MGVRTAVREFRTVKSWATFTVAEMFSPVAIIVVETAVIVKAAALEVRVLPLTTWLTVTEAVPEVATSEDGTEAASSPAR